MGHGIKWDRQSDSLFFGIHGDIQSHSLTKRMMLSQVSSMYDPLGLIGPIILMGKLLLQEVTRCNPPPAWDDPIHDDLTEKWQTWSVGVSDINLLKIPHCVKPSPSNDWSFELHLFSDTSNKAYGCCSYLRSIDEGGNVHTVLLLSKNRVVQNRPITIHRLELD